MTATRDISASSRPPVSLSPFEERAWAKEVAAQAHVGQHDKAGEPYIRHCQRVADAVAGDKAKTVAWLHDVLEKGPGWTVERLLGSGFSPEVVAAVENLTRRPGETKDALTTRAAANPLSPKVKRADLRDNLTQLEGQGKATTEYRRQLQLLDDLENRNRLSTEEDRDAGRQSLEPRRATRRQSGRRARRLLVVLVGLAFGYIAWLFLIG